MHKRNETIISVLKDKYDFENERRNYYDNAISLPVTLLGFIIAGIYFIVTQKTKIGWIDFVMPYLLTVLSITTVISMFFLLRVFFGFKRRYGSFPQSSTVLEDYENIKNYYKNLPNVIEPQEKIDNDLDEFIITWYSNSTDVSIQSNDVRMNNFHRAKLWIVISYFIGTLVFSLYCYSKIDFKPMSDQTTQQNNQTPATTPVNTPKPADAPPPVKPAPAPIRMEKGEKGGKI